MFWKLITGRMSSLRIKIVLSLIGLTIFSVGLSGFASRLVLTERFQDVIAVRSSAEFARDVAGYYRNNGYSLERAYNQLSWDEHIIELNRLRSRSPAGFESAPNTAVLVATDLEGRVWVPNGRFAAGDQVSEQELREAFPVTDNGVQIGYVIVEGPLALSEIESQYLSDLTNSLWLSFFLVLLVAIPSGIYLGKRLTDPINTLSSALQAMRPKTIRQSVPITSKDEIGSLSESFNQMSEEITEFFEVTSQQQQQIFETEKMRKESFVNISHELRTPLYGLVSQANAMLDGIRPLDRNQMAILAENLDHLSELVSDLHYLALADARALSCEIESSDFSLILRNALEARKEVFSAKNFGLHPSLPERLIVDGDPTRLRQIAENLLSNCVRYTAANGDIYVTLKASEGFAELVVADSGPGVPEDSIAALFDRFYRVESSRNRATGGSGLGLSLVKSYAEMQGGDVKAYKSDQNGLAIRVRIPLKSAYKSGEPLRTPEVSVE